MRLPIVMLALLPSLAHAEFKWGERYEHQAHAQQMQAKGKQSPACHACHQIDGRDFSPIAPGRFNHKPCIDCHGGQQFMRGNRCLTCHSNIKAFKPGKPWFPPYRSPGEFHTTFAHAKHVAMIGGAQGDSCGGCHAAQQGKSTRDTRNHAACATCHASSARPDMNACEGCHLPGPPAPRTRSLAHAVSPFRTTDKFDHVRHAQAVAGSPRPPKSGCTSCHAGLGSQEPPGRPAMQACESCHDGRTAFDARGTQCTRCHTGDGAKQPAMASVERSFTHAGHRGTMDMSQCGTCHLPGIDWKSVHAGRNQHQPCQNCHAAEFRMQNQKICLSCHERNDPFTPNPLRPTVRERTEWRLAEVPHPPHIAAGVSCIGCHARQAGEKSGGPSGHGLCGKCHSESQKLTMGQCGRCHLGVAEPVAARPPRPWSTRDRFKHDANHRTATGGPGSGASACDTCHRAGGAADLTSPKMQQCGDTCHDGKKAFKVTGFGCAKCHGQGTLPGKSG